MVNAFYTLQTVSYTHLDVYKRQNMDFLKDDHIAKLLYEKRDMDYLKGIEKQIQSHVEGRLAVSYSSYRYLEFNPIGVSKGAALKWLADYLHMDIQETIAIGDNYNDTSMIKACLLYTSRCV